MGISTMITFLKLQLLTFRGITAYPFFRATHRALAELASSFPFSKFPENFPSAPSREDRLFACPPSAKRNWAFYGNGLGAPWALRC